MKVVCWIQLADPDEYITDSVRIIEHRKIAYLNT